MADYREFDNGVKPNWCPGCGHYAVLNALRRAAANTGIEAHKLAVVSGIGCSGRFSGYMYAYGFHGVHGRALPVAQGIKLANRELTVVACSGDGDGYAIGLGHTIHAIRRNIDMTYIVMDNHVYGLTKGQTSPRSNTGFQTKTTPEGSIETPIPALTMALAAGATFVAQGFSKNIQELIALFERGIRHPGFSFINVFSPCVTFNHLNTYDWFSGHLISADSLADYDPQDRSAAFNASLVYNGLITGLIYQDIGRPSYQELLKCRGEEPLTNAELGLTEADFKHLVAEFC